MDAATRSAWRAALCETDPQAKCAHVAALRSSGMAAVADDARPVPGRPAKPALIHPRDVPSRGLGSVAGRIALLHAVAHIEFNAVNLALDAGWRFAGMPDAFYADWLGVAQDEARHFAMLRARLQALGAEYGDLPAHNGLWEAAESTAHDVLLRMALVPCVLEARGLDVTPGIMRRLREVGDLDSVAVLEVILREEVGHVAIGTRWFRYLCAQRGLEPVATFGALLHEHRVTLRAPLNLEARRAAGFDEAELALARVT